MFNGLLTFMMDLWLRIIAFISNLFFAPVYAFLSNWIPDLNEYLSIIDDFIENYLLKGVAFVREVLFNVTGYPRALFNFLIGFLIVKLTLMMVKWGLKLVLNSYYLLRGSR